MRISEPTKQRGLFLKNSHLDQAKSHKIYGPVYCIYICKASIHFSLLLSTTKPQNVNIIETAGFHSLISLFRFTILFSHCHKSTGLLIFHTVADPRNSPQTRNTAKSARNISKYMSAKHIYHIYSLIRRTRL